MNAKTLSTARTADADLLDMLSQAIDATGDTYPLPDGTLVPYIVAERDVRNGSGRVIGAEYVVTEDTYRDLVDALAQATAAEHAR